MYDSYFSDRHALCSKFKDHTNFFFWDFFKFVNTPEKTDPVTILGITIGNEADLRTKVSSLEIFYRWKELIVKSLFTALIFLLGFDGLSHITYFFQTVRCPASILLTYNFVVKVEKNVIINQSGQDSYLGSFLLQVVGNLYSFLMQFVMGFPN